MNEPQNKSEMLETSPTRDVEKRSRLLIFFLGIMIGLAVIVPGISGSTIAIILGLYPAMLYAMGHVFDDFKRCIRFLIPFGIGAVIGFLVGFFAIQLVFAPYTLQLVCLFVGLMLGAIPALTVELHGQKKTPLRLLLLSFGFIIPIAIALASFFLMPSGGADATFTEFPVSRVLAYLPLGLLVSLTQIVPGLSATAILMAFGQFAPLLNSVHLSYLTEHPQVLLLYVALIVGFGAGLVLLSRIISTILERYRVSAFFMIVGLSFGSIVSMFLGSDMMQLYLSWRADPSEMLLSLPVGGVLFAVGVVCSYLLVRYELRHAQKD